MRHENVIPILVMLILGATVLALSYKLGVTQTRLHYCEVEAQMWEETVHRTYANTVMELDSMIARVRGPYR
jgi:hypothetical protein